MSIIETAFTTDDVDATAKMQSAPPPIDVRALHLYDQQKTVLESIEFQVQTQQCCCLIGNNGAGKSSLIKSLLGFKRIHSGKIHLFGHPHTHRISRSQIAYLPERFLPPYYLTGLAFLRLHQQQMRQDMTTFETKLEVQCDALQLPKTCLNQPIKTLSKGMTQKLGLMACLLSQKPLLLLDEPMSGLDPEARIRVKQQLLNYKQRGHTLLISTHMLLDAEELADQVLLLNNGQTQFIGRVSDCIQDQNSANLETAYMKWLDNKTV